MKILAPISLGELVDKVTILEIKKQIIKDPAKQANIKHELNQLADLLDSVVKHDDIAPFKHKLRLINQTLWTSEDKIRGAIDVKTHLTVSVIIRRFNEYRAEIKKHINETFGSDIIEEKEYKK